MRGAIVRSTLDYDIIDAPDGEPIVFSGPPGRLTARLPVANGGETSAVLRQATVRGGPFAGVAAGAVRTTVLRPGTTHLLRTRLAVPRSTPPGDYECEVEIGGSTRPAILRVAEVVGVVLSPVVLYVENRPGTRLTKRVLVTNRGNVPIRVGSPGGIVLDDERWDCRIARATVDAVGRALEPPARPRRTGGEGEPTPPPAALRPEEALAELFRQGRRHFDSVGHLVARNTAGTTVVEPGAQEVVELTIRVPDGLDQHTRYTGSFPVYDALLDIVIVPGVAEDDGEEEGVS
jgi:hypothetical protein